VPSPKLGVAQIDRQSPRSGPAHAAGHRIEAGGLSGLPPAGPPLGCPLRSTPSEAIQPLASRLAGWTRHRSGGNVAPLDAASGRLQFREKTPTAKSPACAQCRPRSRLSLPWEEQPLLWGSGFLYPRSKMRRSSSRAEGSLRGA